MLADLVEADPGDRPHDAGQARARLLRLPGHRAPYPAGQALLAHAIERACRTPLPGD